EGRSVALLRGPARGLIHALKYEKGFWALRDVRRLLEAAPGLEDWIGDAVLAPVPLHPRRLRERGYNQCELIVEEARAAFPRARAASLLERVIDTQSQTRFDRQERIRNLKNAFA